MHCPISIIGAAISHAGQIRKQYRFTSFALLQGLHHLPDVRNINTGREHTVNVPVCISQHSIAPLNHPFLAIMRDDLVFMNFRVFDRTVVDAPYNVHDAFFILFGYKVVDPQTTNDLVFAQTELFTSGLIDHHYAAIIIEHDKYDRGNIKIGLRTVSFLNNRHFRSSACGDVS